MKEARSSLTHNSGSFFKSTRVSHVKSLYDDKLILKDKNYYRDKTWNNSQFTSSKIHRFYHEKENQFKQKYAELLHQVQQDQTKAKEDYQETLINCNREDARNSYYNIIKHRVTLQNKSLQRRNDQNLERVDSLLQYTEQVPKQNMRSRTMTDNSPTCINRHHRSNFDSNFRQKVNKGNHKSILKWNNDSSVNTEKMKTDLASFELKMAQNMFETILKNDQAEKDKMELLAQRKKTIHDSIFKQTCAKRISQYQPLSVLKSERKQTLLLESMKEVEAETLSEPMSETILEVKREEVLDIMREVKPKITWAFSAQDDPEIRNLPIKSVLQVKGITDNCLIETFIKKNSVVKRLKLNCEKRLSKKPERVKKTSKATVQNEPIEDIWRETTLAIRKFEENLERQKKHSFEFKYPKINLDKIFHLKK